MFTQAKEKDMNKEEHLRRYFNQVSNLTAVCQSNLTWSGREYPELEEGKTYQISHIGVFSSSSYVMLKGFENTEFEYKNYEAQCFEIYENGECIDGKYVNDPRFWAPYLRERYKMFVPHEYADDMEKYAIPAHLKNIEREYDVRILLAVESGSRAWGFESLSSDWDVRFIYVHKLEWYNRVEEQQDIIEHFYEDGVDLAGWELRKALSLLKECNPPLLEWLNSPKVYYVDEEFAKRIHVAEKDSFNPVKAMYHYNHLYNKTNERFLQKEGYPMKRFLYYLRGVLACKWIEANHSMPPVVFKELLDATVDDEKVKAKIKKLIRLKREEKECDMLAVDESLVQYAREWAKYYNKRVGTFRPDESKASSETLDSILYDMVHKHS